METIPWVQFLPAMDWDQGEHVSICGPTGTGKTYLMNQLTRHRKFVTVFGTKPSGGDDTLAKLISDQGYKLITTWSDKPPIIKGHGQRLVLWPTYRKITDRHKQKPEFTHAMESMFMEGSWCVAIDELMYVYQKLKIRDIVDVLYLQGRSKKVSLCASFQRPRNVSMYCYDQATHLFFFRDNDEENLKRIGGIGSLDAKIIRHTVARLPLKHFLYINSRTGEMCVSMVQ